MKRIIITLPVSYTHLDVYKRQDSYHPYSQKKAAFNAFVHRMLAIPLEQKDRVEETNIIKSIAIANGYNGEIVDKLVRKHSVKINSKSRLTGPSKEDTKFIVTAVSYTHLDVYKRQTVE